MWRFETDRMSVAPWTAALQDPDRASVLEEELRGVLTPAALAPLPDVLHLHGSEPDVAACMMSRADQSVVCTVRNRVKDRLIGLLICAEPEPKPDGPVHLGCLIAERDRSRGYATELMRGVVRVAAGQALLAGVARDNPASARLLEEAGFVMEEDASDPDTPMFICAHP